MRATDKKSIFYVFLSLYLSQKKKKGGSQSLEENGRYGRLKKQTKKTVVVGVKMAQTQHVLCVLSEVMSSIPRPLVTHKHR